MAAPEGRPRLLPFLYSEGEEEHGVEEGPGAVGEVSALFKYN